MKVQQVTVVSILSEGVNIPSYPPPYIHIFLKVYKVTSLKSDYSLTYVGPNLYLPTSLCQDILHGHILEVTDPDSPNGISPLLTPLESYGSGNAQKRVIRVQVLIAMGQD